MDNYKVKKIDDHTWQLEDPFRTYMYLVEGNEKALLIDAGNGFSGLKDVLSALTDKPVTVVMTHGHFDHTGASAEFEECWIHQFDVQVLLDGFEKCRREKQMLRFKELFEVPLSEKEMDYLVNGKAPGKLNYFREGDLFELGGRTLEVIETPGHTRGCVCFLDRDHRYLFAGDTGCNREILVYFDHSGGVEDVKRSAEKLLARRNEFAQIWPGHHECPMSADCIEDYRKAAEDIMKDPGIGEKIILDQEYKILYRYKSIGISYTESHIYR